MPNKTNEDKEKVKEYLDVIEQKVLSAIRDTNIKDYCSASLLILFSAIDGLGKLLHPKDNAGSNARICHFLDYMGDDYKKNKKQLLFLRNSLVHNALNVESFLSNSDMSTDHHLRMVDDSRYIFVNTSLMFDDIEKTFKRFQNEIFSNSAMMKRAADRLEWHEEDVISEDDANEPMPTPPPSIRFIYTKPTKKKHCGW